MSYIGQQLPADVFSGFTTDSFTGDGSATTFTLSKAPFSEDTLIVVINNVIQKPTTNFTVSGTTLTIVGTAVADGDVLYAIHTGGPIPITTPGDGSVTTAKIVDDAVTGAKLANDIAITTSGDVSFDGGSFVFNESSADKDFRIESNGNTHMLFVDGGNDKVGVGESANAPMGTLHVKTADSGDTAIDVNNDDLVVENDNHAGITISTPNDKAGGLYFSDPDATASGRIVYDHSANDMSFTANGTGYITIDSSMTGVRIDSGKFSTFGEDAPDCGDGGITLQRGANDDKVFTVKSTDVAHGMTGSCETDTFMLMTKQDANKGGFQIRTFAEDLNAERLNINVQGDGDILETKSTSSKGAITLTNSSKSGTAQTYSNSDGIIMTIANYIHAQFLFEADGNFHANAGSNTFDAYEDAQLARAYDLSHGKGVIESKFDKFVAYNHEKLAQLDLVGREEDGTPNHMVNVTGMQRLHNGAIWQQYEKHQRLAEAVYEMAKEALGKDKADAILEKHDIKLLN